MFSDNFKVTAIATGNRRMLSTGKVDILQLKGAGVFERPGQTMDQLFVFGTSRTSNGLKSGL